MSKQPTKRSAIQSKGGKKEPAFARKATQHHDFIGEAAPERAEAELKKHARVEKEHEKFVVEEMKRELEEVAEQAEPLLPLRMPTSIRDGVSMLKETASPETFEKLRKKAEERLEELPQPFHRALELAQQAAKLLSAPVSFGVRVVSQIVKTPAAMLRLLTRRQREA